MYACTLDLHVLSALTYVGPRSGPAGAPPGRATAAAVLAAWVVVSFDMNVLFSLLSLSLLWHGHARYDKNVSLIKTSR